MQRKLNSKTIKSKPKQHIECEDIRETRIPFRSDGIILFREADFIGYFRVRSDAIKTLTATAGVPNLVKHSLKQRMSVKKRSSRVNTMKAKSLVAVTVTKEAASTMK